MTEQATSNSKKSHHQLLLFIVAVVLLFGFGCITAFIVLKNTPGTNETAAWQIVTVSQITPVPTNMEGLGASPDKPFPFGTRIDIGDSMFLRVVNALRPADPIVINLYQFYTRPGAGQEYLEVDLMVECIAAKNDKCVFDYPNVQPMIPKGDVGSPAVVVLPPVNGMMDPFTEFFGGTSFQGKMFFIIPQDDNTLELIYKSLHPWDSPIYFKFQ